MKSVNEIRVSRADRTSIESRSRHGSVSPTRNSHGSRAQCCIRALFRTILLLGDHVTNRSRKRDGISRRRDSNSRLFPDICIPRTSCTSTTSIYRRRRKQQLFNPHLQLANVNIGTRNGRICNFSVEFCICFSINFPRKF